MVAPANVGGYGCYTTTLAISNKSPSAEKGSFNGYYHSVNASLTGVTKVTSFNTDEVVNGMNAALATYNAIEGLAEANKCDKHWAKGETYPVLVDGAPTAN